MCFGVDDPFAKIRWLDERASGREHDFGEFIMRYVRDFWAQYENVSCNETFE